MKSTQIKHSPRKRQERKVYMPHLDRTVLTIVEDGRIESIPRWTLIQAKLKHLRNEITKIKDAVFSEEPEDSHSIASLIEDCVLTYNPHLDCNFRVLFDSLDGDSAWQHCCYVTITFIIDSALRMSQLFPEPLKLLNGRHSSEVISLSKSQACCILANGFFCTFPRREASNTKFSDYPRINFTLLFDDKLNTLGSGWQIGVRAAKIEKVKCFLNYFFQMRKRLETNVDPLPPIVFERRSLLANEIPDWSSSRKPLLHLTVFENGVIEDSIGSLQVDFANQLIGGGVLGNGSAMEEIRFSCCPELVCGQLFTKVLGDTEAILVHNYEQFSTHSGYASTFKFGGNFMDDNVHQNHIVCMDAYYFPKNSLQLQLQKQWIDRELNKCLVSFKESDVPEIENMPVSNVASGKWGCGIFNGDPLLKCLIQWMAASLSEKNLQLYTFRDERLIDELGKVQELVLKNKFSVGHLYTILASYADEVALSLEKGIETQSFPKYLETIVEKANLQAGSLEGYLANMNSGTNSNGRNLILKRIIFIAQMMASFARLTKRLLFGLLAIFQRLFIKENGSEKRDV